MQGSAFIPENANALEFMDQLKRDEIVMFKNVTARDIKLHGCYFVLLSEVWGYMPKSFRDTVPDKLFYQWLKMYQNKYEVIFEFKNGKQLVKYESISFGRMNNNRFKEYIKDQIPDLYDILEAALKNPVLVKAAIETIEENFEKMFSKL